MKILFIETFLSPSNGGVERVTYRLGTYFSLHGIETYYLFKDKDYGLIPCERKLQIDFTHLTYREFRSKLIRFINSNRIEVIIIQHIFNDTLWFILRKIKRKCSCEIITVFHISPDYYLYLPKNTKWSKRKIFYKLTGIYPTTFTGVVRKFYEISDKFILLSDSFKQDFIKYYGIGSPEKLLSIPNPCTFDENIPIEKVGNKKKQVLIVSRFWEKQKNLCSALRIWKLIEANGLIDWQLIIAGEGQDRDMIVEYAKKMELKNYDFIGPVSNPKPLYEVSRIFMMTSNFEGWGMTLAEALQNGCVPIVFDTYSALHDIIIDSYNGFIISPNAENAFAEKMVKLMKDYSLWRELSNNAIISSSRFSLEVVGQKWHDLLNNLVSSNSTSFVK